MKAVLSLALIFWIASFDSITSNHSIYEEALLESAISKQHILILFTSKTCTNPMQASALINSSQKIKELLQNEFIFLELFVDDATPLIKKEVYRSNHGVYINTVGGRNADFEIEVFGENVQPYYVIVDWDEVVISTSKHIDTADEFMEFLAL